MIDDILEEAELAMELSIEALQNDYNAMRTGRASTGIVEKLMVNYYGQPTSLKQLALLSVPEPQLISIKPYDTSAMKEIEKAIMESDIGLTPNNDGKIIRLQIPSLTEERRRNLSKTANKRSEDAKISIRNARRDALNALKNLEKEKEITEDDHHHGRDQVQKLTDQFTGKVEETWQAKNKEIMDV